MTSDPQRTYAGLREFPSVEIVASMPELEPFIRICGRPLVVDHIRQVIETAKTEFQEKTSSWSQAKLQKAIVTSLSALTRHDLQPVINAAGIIIHTNLGRSPLPMAMLEKTASLVSGYTNLEFDLKTGRRGKRGILIENLLASYCRTENGTVVNNNAAALLIILNTLGYRKEVIISRGELVQIGGGFKIPEIMKKAGVRLIEVGTTNRTSVDDYAAAITDRTAMLLKIHRSNFSQRGFVEETPPDALARLGDEHDIATVFDLGSGLTELPPGIMQSGEPTIAEAVRSGVDIICFSGDKLLGGPQAGLIIGRDEYIVRIKNNPMFRALRCDKIIFSLLMQTLQSYLNGTWHDDLPIWRMITVPVGDLKLRGEAIKKACPDKDIVLKATQAYLGGGSTPDETIASLAVSIRVSGNINKVASAFRAFEPPIIGRVEDDEFLLDIRTVPPEQDAILIDAINSLVD